MNGYDRCTRCLDTVCLPVTTKARPIAVVASGTRVPRSIRNAVLDVDQDEAVAMTDGDRAADVFGQLLHRRAHALADRLRADRRIAQPASGRRPSALCLRAWCFSPESFAVPQLSLQNAPSKFRNLSFAERN